MDDTLQEKKETPSETNILTGSDFANGLQGWINEIHSNGEIVAYTHQGNPCIKITRPTSGAWAALGQEVRSKMEIGQTYTVSLRYNVLSGDNLKLIFRIATASIDNSGVLISSDCIVELIEDIAWHTITLTYTESEAISRENYPNIAVYSDYNGSSAEAELLVDDFRVDKKQP